MIERPVQEWGDWKLLEYLKETFDKPYSADVTNFYPATQELITRFEQMQRDITKTLDWFTEARDSASKITSDLEQWRAY